MNILVYIQHDGDRQLYDRLRANLSQKLSGLRFEGKPAHTVFIPQSIDSWSEFARLATEDLRPFDAIVTTGAADWLAAYDAQASLTRIRKAWPHATCVAYVDGAHTGVAAASAKGVYSFVAGHTTADAVLARALRNDRAAVKEAPRTTQAAPVETPKPLWYRGNKLDEWKAATQILMALKTANGNPLSRRELLTACQQYSAKKRCASSIDTGLSAARKLLKDDPSPTRAVIESTKTEKKPCTYTLRDPHGLVSLTPPTPRP